MKIFIFDSQKTGREGDNQKRGFASRPTVCQKPGPRPSRYHPAKNCPIAKFQGLPDSKGNGHRLSERYTDGGQRVAGPGRVQHRNRWVLGMDILTTFFAQIHIMKYQVSLRMSTFNTASINPRSDDYTLIIISIEFLMLY